MYNNIKSCVKNKNETSVFLHCQSGVRQGENFSPLLFAIYLNDLESFLSSSGSDGQSLLYADDTVIFSDDKSDFQKCLDAFNDYRYVETDY